MFIKLIILLIIVLLFAFAIYGYLPSIYNKRKFLNREKNNEKTIYLTFDDGPSEYTNELLDLLKSYNIKATFFCVANFAKVYKNIINRMVEDGHLIAGHSLKHKNYMIQTPFETKRDIDDSIRIMNQFDLSFTYFRPPWGDVNLYLLHKLKKENINLIFWDVMAEDWEKDTTSNIIAQKLRDRVQDNDIICLHDGRGSGKAPLKTIEALKIVLPEFLEKGYKFKTINE